MRLKGRVESIATISSDLRGRNQIDEPDIGGKDNESETSGSQNTCIVLSIPLDQYLSRSDEQDIQEQLHVTKGGD